MAVKAGVILFGPSEGRTGLSTKGRKGSLHVHLELLGVAYPVVVLGRALGEREYTAGRRKSKP